MLLILAYDSLPMHSKANLLILGCGEGKCGVHCQARSSGKLALQQSELPKGFQRKIFKARVREGGLWNI